jgi:N-acetylated-alpha-linked acidic dipeptidase
MRATVATMVFVGLAAALQNGDERLIGFAPEGSATQLALEARYDAQLDAALLEDWNRRLSSAPNHVGAPHNRQNAEFMAGLFREWGFETEIETFQVLFPTPRTRVLELVSPRRYRARLTEPTLAEDRTSRITEGRLPPYNAYSADGDVTAELVYVNYGVPADYEELERLGVDVRGRIVIARYGGSWRGIKPKVAAEHGAVGCIIYSDPRDDGYFEGDVYPKGAWRMEWGAQRGSVADMPVYPGDPLTPFVGATEGARRLTVAESRTIMKIPVLPISYGDAQPLLAALEGPVAPRAWRGALPVTYHVGPGPARVHLAVAFDWSLKPAYDVIARLRGAEDPEAWVIRGNHHDAWVFGAEDPLSGLVTLLAEARAVGALAKAGWRPRRTIVYAAWDAEEPGLLGSTEWVEQHAEALDRHAVAYINTDGNGRGFLGVGGSHTLQAFINQVARAVPDPETGVSAAERLRARRRVNGDGAADSSRELDIEALGSGSDYTPFLQHLGIASLDLSFGGEDGGGSYHSVFDSFDHYSRFGDPGFVYGVALAKTAGRATLRLADADLLPFVFRGLVTHVRRYVREVEELADSLRTATERHNALVEADAFRLRADPTQPYVPSAAKGPVPYLNFAPLLNAAARLDQAAARFDSAAAAATLRGLPRDAARRLNEVMLRSERLLADERGLPRRPWFRHQIYAPGFYTGYGVKTLPGVREAIEERHWDELDLEMPKVAQALERLADALEQEAQRLESAGD